MRVFGLRMSRNIASKEVIIEDPDYLADAERLQTVCHNVEIYSEEHSLLRWPNPIKVFFHPGDDHEIEHISEELETIIEDLSNSRDKIIMHELNNYPIMATHAHTRPFERRWLNIVTGLLIPVGMFFYFRMLRFRLRLYKDLRLIIKTSEHIIARINQLHPTKNI